MLSVQHAASSRGFVPAMQQEVANRTRKLLEIELDDVLAVSAAKCCSLGGCRIVHSPARPIWQEPGNADHCALAEPEHCRAAELLAMLAARTLQTVGRPLLCGLGLLLAIRSRAQMGAASWPCSKPGFNLRSNLSGNL